MSKQEEIKRAYGKNWPVFEEFTSMNGWVKRRRINYKIFYSREDVDLTRDASAFRLKTLSHLKNPATEKLKKIE